MRRASRNVFAIDLRGLAVFRVALGLILIADLIIRGGDLVAHYTDWGALPRRMVAANAADWRVSLHMLGGTAAYQAVLFLLAGIAAFALAIGYRTRLAVAASWLLLLSLHNRNPLVLQGGDNLLLLLLFWSLFLPLGARGSVDAALNRGPAVDNRYASMASAGILIQAMSVYFFSAFLKSSPDWRSDGTAVYYALHIDQFATPVAEWLRQFPTVMGGLTHYVWWLELLGPLLMFVPFARVPLRTLLVVMFVTMEIGFLLCLRIGLFPFVSIASLLLFLPTELWDRWSARTATVARRGLVLYFDQDCAFCEKICRILRSVLVVPGARIVPAQSDPRWGPVLEAEDSWIVVDASGNHLLRWQGVVTVIRHSAWLAWLAPLLDRGVLAWLGERTYRWIAGHRGLLSRLSHGVLPWREQPRRSGVIGATLAAAALVYVTWWNLSTVPQWNVAFPRELASIKNLLRLDQVWNMFASRPRRDDGWFVMPGALLDGRPVDVYHATAGEADFGRPASVAGQFPNYRWRKYLTRLWRKRYTRYRQDYGRYLCRSWNSSAAGNDRLRRFRIYYVEERTLPDYVAPELTRHRIWRHWCFPGDQPTASTGEDHRPGPGMGAVLANRSQGVYSVNLRTKGRL